MPLSLVSCSLKNIVAPYETWTPSRFRRTRAMHVDSTVGRFAHVSCLSATRELCVMRAFSASCSISDKRPTWSGRRNSRHNPTSSRRRNSYTCRLARDEIRATIYEIPPLRLNVDYWTALSDLVYTATTSNSHCVEAMCSSRLRNQNGLSQKSGARTIFEPSSLVTATSLTSKSSNHFIFSLNLSNEPGHASA
jgi:hypothetical protein